MRLGNRPLPYGGSVHVRVALRYLSLAPFFALLSALAACQGIPDTPASPGLDAVTALFALGTGPVDPPQCFGAWNDPVCDDDDPCTIQACIDGICRYAPSPDPACCNSDADCDDGSPCTTENCSPEHVCFRTVLDDPPGCCTTHADCQPGGKSDDGDPCNIDYCRDSVCQPVWQPSTCDPGQGGTCQSDGNPCTQDKCVCDAACPTNCQCEHVWMKGCCVQDKDCNDWNVCTVDKCLDGKCFVMPAPTCCVNDLGCADFNPCNLDKCVNHVCRYSPNPALTECCKTDVDCNDGISCTVEFCDLGSHACVKTLVPNQTPKCCWTATECDDGDPFTIDKCTKNQCVNKSDPVLCDITHPCNDNNPCTSDSCANKKCVYTVLNGCCINDLACSVPPLSDGNVCTTDECVNNKCVFEPIPQCCESNWDCGSAQAWDDGSVCTLDLCIAGRCRHVTQDPGCCMTDLDCNDHWECTVDWCDDFKCANIPYGKYLWAGQCLVDMDCSDNKKYTMDWCDYGCCHNDLLPYTPQCTIDSEATACNDMNPCTCDRCVFFLCHNLPPDLAPADCNIPKDCCTKLSDCPPSSNPCVVTSCDEGKCVYVKLDPCSPYLPFVATFNPCSTLDEYWQHSEPADGSGKWWTCAGQGALGPDPHAAFVPAGQAVEPVEALLATNALSATGAGVVTMQWSWAFAHGEGSATVGAYLVGWSGGPVPQGLEALKEIVVDKDLPATHEEVQLPPDIDPMYLRVGFGVKAESSVVVKSFELDDVRICPGHPPEWNGAPGPQEIGLGEKWTVELSAWNVEAAEELDVSFVGSAPSFAKLSDPLLDPESGEWSVTLSLAPSLPKDVDEYVLTVRVSDGCLVDDIQVPVAVFGP
ncbi:MAG: hypothetical protein FJ109_16130 [Deltaproteobacteria bacterium]|nr:hypothetical protein [Deltaproteobacteria bacterium]